MMSSVKVTIKPKGLIAFAVLTAALTALAVSLVLSRQSLAQRTASSPSGNSSSGAATAAASDIYENDDERQEAATIAQLNRMPGQQRDWLFLGPITAGNTSLSGPGSSKPEDQMALILNTPFLPDEAKYQARENAAVTVAGTSYVWRKVTGCAFDFKRMFASPERPATSLRNKVVYAVTTIDSPKAGKKLLHFRSDDGAVVWLNGAQVYRSTVIRGCRDEDIFSVPLRQGRNTLLVKVGQWGGGWAMAAQIEEAAAPATLEAAVTPKAATAPPAR